MSEETIYARVQRQIERVLDAMEEHPERYGTKDRLALIQVVSMYLSRDIKIKAANESEHAGSAVRKYSGAFRQANGARRPARSARSDNDADHTIAPEFDTASE